MQVAPQPAAFLLACRDDRHTRPPQIGGQPDPAHGEAERADQLLEDLSIARPDRGSVGPPDDQPADDLVAMAEQDLTVVRRFGTGRRHPLPTTGSRDVDGHRVEAELPLETGHQRGEQVVARVGADVVDDPLHDAERVVTSAVHEAVDEALDPMPRRLGDQSDRAGRGDEEPRRTVLAEQAPEPADETRVHDRDPGRQQQPLEDPMRCLLETRRRAPYRLDHRSGDEQRHGRQQQQRRHDVAPGELPVDEVEARRDDRQPRRAGTR